MEKSHKHKLSIVHEKQREFRESDGEQLLESKETIQGPLMTGPKEERLTAERKQDQLNKSAQKVVKQMVTDIHLDYQTQDIQQTQTSED